MYVRRKVFSVLVDETGEERLYSVNETLLDDYDYEEREFAEKEEEEPKKGGKGKKVALGVAGAAATTAAGLYAAKKGLLGRKAADGVNRVIMKHTKSGGKLYENAVKDRVNAHKKAITKHAEEVVAKKHSTLDKMSRKNISDALAKQNLEKLEKGMRKFTPGK